MGSSQRQFLAPDALYFAYPSVGIEFGGGEKLVAGLFDGVFHPQPVEQRALGLLLAGGDSSRRRKWGRRGLTPFHLWSDLFTETCATLNRYRGGEGEAPVAFWGFIQSALPRVMESQNRTALDTASAAPG